VDSLSRVERFPLGSIRAGGDPFNRFLTFDERPMRATIRTISSRMRTTNVPRTAFVMEQTLGHITHSKNLRSEVDRRTDVAPVWLPIAFAPGVASRLVPLVRNNWSVRASWRARRALQTAMNQRPLDALLFHTQVTALFSVGLMRRLPTIVSLDATPMNYDTVGLSYAHKPAGEGFIDKRKYQINRSVFHAAARLVTWSAWARRSLIDDYGVDPARIRILAPGANAAFFDIGARRAAAPPTTDVDRPVNVLFVGGDFERKGGRLLLDVFRSCIGQQGVLHLVTQAEVSPEENVRVYRGITPNSPKLLRLFAESDVLVLPSMGECLAVVLMEATAAGLPVITTDVGALREAVRSGESGLVIRAGEGAELRSALLRLLTDAGARRSMGRAGHALARDKFDAHRNNQALLDLLVEQVQVGRESGRVA
jgi:glycosyltransferase involved in cell wall biosynthesis